ncbi:MAG: two-component system, OmpR family, sensor kinase [Nocardioidaceae bacterium]|jgi:two-component system OmpR family sensor kinase|nr:two-component system, OmpR family, sensor kinase [Nocardioidaceae bacterium]
MRFVPASLTGRLVLTVITLVAVGAFLVSTVTALAMHAYLNARLDQQVNDALERASRDYVGAGSPALPTPGHDGDEGPGDGPGDGPPVGEARGQGAGTVTAVFDTHGDRGNLLTQRGSFQWLTGPALTALHDVPADGEMHAVVLPHLGSFRVRVLTIPDGSVVSGLSTSDNDAILHSLLAWEALLALGGVVLTGATGWWLVRRQLAPLREVAATAHEVATLPLSDGAIGTTARVPDRLADERTEVGQVGSALNSMLEHVEEALDARHRSELQVRQFVADASHELRTPLSTIHGYAELSRRSQPPDVDQLRSAMTKVESETHRMSALVEDLLLLARLDAGRPLSRDDVDLTHLLLEAVNDARVVGADHRWILDVPDEPVVVPGDERRLHQVVTNLLNNARRHTPKDTIVTIGVRPEGREAVLTVEDDGPGLPPDLVDHVFERFTRGDTARTRESGGAGLGLSLVEAISTAHGGTVTVMSRPGSTRFEVRLPAAAAPTTAAPAPERVHRDRRPV